LGIINYFGGVRITEICCINRTSEIKGDVVKRPEWGGGWPCPILILKGWREIQRCSSGIQFLFIIIITVWDWTLFIIIHGKS